MLGFATASGMGQRVENGETITDTRGPLAIADNDGGFVDEVTWFVRHWGPTPATPSIDRLPRESRRPSARGARTPLSVAETPEGVSAG